MGLQTIINMAETIEIDRRRVMGVQYSRSEIARITETATRNPWRFTVTVPAMLAYDEYRSLMEDIDRLDRRYPEVVSFSTATQASSGLSYMFAYQGQLSQTQLDAITVASWTGTNLVLNNVPVSSTGTVAFRKGDFIQVAGLPYPVTTQYDVPCQTTSTVSVTTHRPSFLGTATTGQNILVGNAVEFKMFVNNMPTYRITAGGSTALVTWSGPFQFYEYTGDV